MHARSYALAALAAIGLVGGSGCKSRSEGGTTQDVGAAATSEVSIASVEV